MKKIFLGVTVALVSLMIANTCYAAAAAPSFFCAQVKAYLATHTEKEGRARAAQSHIPQWLIKKAEECLK